MVMVGIDVGGRSHAAARCRDGHAKADREVVRVSQSRAGFAALDSWLERQAEPASLVTMESSGRYWMPLASHLRRRDVPVALANPLAANELTPVPSGAAIRTSPPAHARDGGMKKRWLAAGLLEAERSFRRIKGYEQMPVLVAGLQRATGATPSGYDAAVA